MKINLTKLPQCLIGFWTALWSKISNSQLSAEPQLIVDYWWAPESTSFCIHSVYNSFIESMSFTGGGGICSGFTLVEAEGDFFIFLTKPVSLRDRQAGRDYSHCDATNIAFPDVFPLSLPKLWDELKYLPTSHEMRLRLERKSRKEGVLSPTTNKECQVILRCYVNILH